MSWFETEINIFVILLCTYPIQFGLVFVAGALATIVVNWARREQL